MYELGIEIVVVCSRSLLLVFVAKFRWNEYVFSTEAVGESKSERMSSKEQARWTTRKR